MSEEEIFKYFDEYLSKPENLHRLREKLFNLEGYRLKSDADKETANLREVHEKAVKEKEEEHREEIRQTKEKYKEKLKDKESEFDRYKNSVKGELQEAAKNKTELDRWKSDYRDLDVAFRKFSALSPKHKNDVAGIFGGCDTPLDFLCGSVQKGHLEQLWDYVRDELNAPDSDGQEAILLSSLFDFSFDAVNRSQREPLFRRFVVSQGTAFDGDTMGRTPDSPQLGRVKQMIFAGFAHEVTGSVVRRSLVKLEQ